MSEPVKIYLVRHGETDLNRDKRFRGHSDVPLNEDGVLQAAGAARMLKLADVTSIYTSPIRRSVETATAIAVVTGARMETDDDFVDIDYGEWQGLTVEEARRKNAGEYEAWERDPGSFTFPGGDSIAAVTDRLRPAFARLVEREQEGPFAVVSHLAVLKLCFTVLMDVSADYFWRVGLENGAVSLFTYQPETGYTLESWNQPPFSAAGGVAS